MALTIFPGDEPVSKLKKCFDCDGYCMNVQWYTILETEDDGFSIPLCEDCIDGRDNE